MQSVNLALRFMLEMAALGGFGVLTSKMANGGWRVSDATISKKLGWLFVSVTQSINTATSMGQLTLNMLLSFAQFDREVTAERTIPCAR